jgi:hypothetical protein
MSTRVSHSYRTGKEYSHFFEDVADGLYHIEKEQKNLVNLTLTLEDVISIAKSVNIEELTRQSSISDDQIKKYVFEEYNKNKLKIGLSFCWLSTVYGNSEFSDEQRIEKGICYYSKIREKIKETLNVAESYRVSQISFGLECIK